MQIINDFSYNKPSFRAGLTKKFKNEIDFKNEYSRCKYAVNRN